MPTQLRLQLDNKRDILSQAGFIQLPNVRSYNSIRGEDVDSLESKLSALGFSRNRNIQSPSNMKIDKWEHPELSTQDIHVYAKFPNVQGRYAVVQPKAKQISEDTDLDSQIRELALMHLSDRSVW